MNLKKQREIAEEKLKEIDNKIKKKKSINKSGKTKFYNFNQNNSGGYFIENENLTTDVFIEAHDKEEANLRANDFGIYFDGCEQGIDCSCCGDRWHEIFSEDDGMEKPEIYNHSEIRKLKDCYEDTFAKRAIIHFLDGKKKEVIFKKSNDGHKHIWEQKYDIGEKCRLCGKWKKSSSKKRNDNDKREKNNKKS